MLQRRHGHNPYLFLTPTRTHINTPSTNQQTHKNPQEGFCQSVLPGFRVFAGPFHCDLGTSVYVNTGMGVRGGNEMENAPRRLSPAVPLFFCIYIYDRPNHLHTHARADTGFNYLVAAGPLFLLAGVSGLLATHYIGKCVVCIPCMRAHVYN